MAGREAIRGRIRTPDARYFLRRRQKSPEVMFQGHYAQIIKLHAPQRAVFIAARFDNPAGIV